MISVNTKDGKTVNLDLCTSEGLQGWREMAQRQNVITGITLFHGKVNHAITLPRNFRSIQWEAEPIVNGSTDTAIGERVTVQSDEIRFEVLLYREGSRPMARCGLVKTGKRRFIPSKPETVSRGFRVAPEGIDKGNGRKTP